MSRILVALSGGVDSAVAAHLLQQQGHEIHAAYIRTWMNEEHGKLLGNCPWEDDIAHATAVATHLRIPFHTLNLIEDYRRHIVQYLVDGYRHGATPNPDIMCNREMKFGRFLRHALEHGYDAIATGHYARRQDDPDGTPAIHLAQDPGKDQTYFLALLDPAQIQHAHFPLGQMTKAQVRAHARRHAFPNATRKDSQGICFLGKVNINEFLAHYIPDNPGPIQDNDTGKILGRHRGLHHHTIGQRKGIGIPSNRDHRHYVVVAKNPASNTLHIALETPAHPQLHTTTASIRDIIWQTPAPPGTPVDLHVRVRHRDAPTPARLIPNPAGTHTAHIHFQHPQRGIAPGQILALYDGTRLLGGGIFCLKPAGDDNG
ncbi:MAG: tRNA 2-thiouridine(34) synthase MnmA [Puniceicoccales bacterium]|jgi:tRNA-specific 2-thiouridylase|nr:tRNA 2-thiouridine(34) synthase MnmA [Puniceicoccales bacterium]